MKPVFLFWAVAFSLGAAVGERRTLEDGDLGFTGVNEVDPPGLLQPGEVGRGVNRRYTTGEIAPRLGVAKLGWATRITAGATSLAPWGTIYGRGEFRDADGVRWTLLAADGKVWKCQQGMGAGEVPLPPGESITYDVTFEQSQQGIVMWRGDDHRPLYLKTLDAGFVPIAQETNTVSGVYTENSKIDPTSGSRIALDGTAEIPNARSGEWINGRMFIPHVSATDGKDLVAISDYLNATRYAPIRAQGRINQGSSDRLVRVKKFDEERAVAFKDGSIYGLYNLSGNLSEMLQDEITREFGLAAEKSVVQVGKDIEDPQRGRDMPTMLWFLAPKRGIMQIAVGANGKLQVGAVPVSREIQKTMDRIDWRNASKAAAGFWNNKFYLAAPLDDSKGYGPNMLAGMSYGPIFSSTINVPVEPGVTYLWEKGSSNETINGSGEDGEVTSTSATFTLDGTAGGAVQASLRRVYSGVNNAIVVYDFVRGKWAGYDTGSALMVKEFGKAEVYQAERLTYTSEDGWVNLVEELLYDETAYESYGNNLLSGSYSGGVKEFTVVAGCKYVYALSTHEYSLTNGTEVVVGDGASVYGSFIAQGTRVRLQADTGFESSSVTGGLWLQSWTLDTEWIETEDILRQYTCGNNARKRFYDGELNLRGWYPQYAILARTDGVSEEVPVVPRIADTYQTKDATKYARPFNKAKWDPTNRNDDHAARDREDYHVSLGEATTASGSIAAGIWYYVEDLTGAASINYNGGVVTAPALFQGVAGVTTFTVVSGTPLVYGPGNYVFLKESGIDFDLEQEWSEPLPFPATVRGRWVELRIVNTQGRLTVTGAHVEAERVDRQRSGGKY